MNRFLACLFACVLACLFVSVQLASAHAFIDHCSPALASTNAQPPKEVRCVFTDAVDAKQAKLQVFNANNARVDNNDLKSDPNDKDGKTLFVTLNTAKITGGVYTVKWEAVASDGDKTDGQWQFSVGAQVQALPFVSISAPAPQTKLDNVPSDVPVSIRVSNFTLGQNNNHWQVFIDDDNKLLADIKDASTTTTLKKVGHGVHLIKVALLTSNDVVATASSSVLVGVEEEEHSDHAPQQIPKTGADNSAELGWAALLALEGVVLLFIARSLRRAS
ncbi:MAG: copper resistance protein CopC [Chloroflexi bacterium]|nr:copper resistance protein CopC [Chloroflexota bacterium]